MSPGDLLRVVGHAVSVYSGDFDAKKMGELASGTHVVFLDRSQRFHSEVVCLTPIGVGQLSVSELRKEPVKA